MSAAYNEPPPPPFSRPDDLVSVVCVEEPPPPFSKPDDLVDNRSVETCVKPPETEVPLVPEEQFSWLQKVVDAAGDLASRIYRRLVGR